MSITHKQIQLLNLSQTLQNFSQKTIFLTKNNSKLLQNPDIMSSLSQAGKASLSNEVNRAFTKGLYGVDPNELEKKEMQKKLYQEQLKRQAEQQQRRKAAEKAREKLEDEKLQKKIEMDILKEKEEKEKTSKQDKNQNTFTNSNSTNTKVNSSTNPSQPPQSSSINPPKNYPYPSSQQQTSPIITKNTYSSPQISLYKTSSPYESYTINNPISNQPPYHNNQLPLQSYAARSIYSMEEEKYYQQEMQNRARRFKQTLDRKLQEVYKQIQVSKKSYGSGENVLDEIRRRLKSNSYLGENSSELQKSNIKQFQDEFSMFYKIPKRSDNNNFSSTNNQTLKNLDYNSQSRYKSSLRNYNLQSQDNSRINNTDRHNQSQYNQTRKWGNKRNNNFLGNRQALDYKIQSALSNIDNIIETSNLKTGGDF